MILLDTRRPVTATIPTVTHTPACVTRAARVLDLTGAFGGRIVSAGQRHAETVDALTDADIECTCPGAAEWDRLTGGFAQ